MQCMGLKQGYSTTLFGGDIFRKQWAGNCPKLLFSLCNLCIHLTQCATSNHNHQNCMWWMAVTDSTGGLCWFEICIVAKCCFFCRIIFIHVLQGPPVEQAWSKEWKPQCLQAPVLLEFPLAVIKVLLLSSISIYIKLIFVWLIGRNQRKGLFPNTPLLFKPLSGYIMWTADLAQP